MWTRDAFGYLGGRELVVPFYESCRWKRIFARKRSVGRDGEPVVDEPGPSILILPIASLGCGPIGISIYADGQAPWIQLEVSAVSSRVSGGVLFQSSSPVEPTF